MTDNQAATPETDASQTPPQPQVTERPVTNEERIQIMRNSILQTGWNLCNQYRNFLKQLPIEPSQMASLLGKVDDSWYMARVIAEDMQINLPQQ